MTTITAALLFLGTCLGGFGFLAFLAAVPGMPDVETLRLTYLAALYGRRVGRVGIALWLATWPTASAGDSLLFAAAAVTVVVSYLVTRAAPKLMWRAAAWSL